MKSILKIYSQLSLDPAKISKILPDAIVAPPIGQDDIYRDLRNGIRIIAIIDGRFHQDLAVTCGELMDALRCGISVFGASSMGAMRAAELDEFGMIGHGKIYEHIKASPAFRDDYLGQVFADEGRIEGLTVPYVDFYFNLRILRDRGRITNSVFNKLTELYSEIYYPERNWHFLAEKIRKEFGKKNPQIENAACQALLKMGSQKERDALSLLRRIKSHQAEVLRLNATLCRASR